MYACVLCHVIEVYLVLDNFLDLLSLHFAVFCGNSWLVWLRPSRYQSFGLSSPLSTFFLLLPFGFSILIVLLFLVFLVAFLCQFFLLLYLVEELATSWPLYLAFLKQTVCQTLPVHGCFCQFVVVFSWRCYRWTTTHWSRTVHDPLTKLCRVLVICARYVAFPRFVFSFQRFTLSFRLNCVCSVCLAF